MFITNEDIINRLNLVYSKDYDSNHSGRLTLPNKEDILDKLRNREIILFFYLRTNEVKLDSDGMPQLNLYLRKFFAYPFGDKFWVDDPAFQVLADQNHIISQDICNKIIDERYEKYTHLKLKDNQDMAEMLLDFTGFLNRLYEDKFAD